jgi:hypothetical protein
MAVYILYKKALCQLRFKHALLFFFCKDSLVSKLNI